MRTAELILAAVTAQRGGELILAAVNTRRLKADGAVEVAGEHYPLMVAVHAAWLISLWVFGHDAPLYLPALFLYLVLQVLRFWVMATLGSRWTTRIIVLPGAPLVAAGPYRYLNHPNYVVVTCEIAILPLALGLPLVALIFSILNAAMLTVRIRAENHALSAAREFFIRIMP